MGSKRFSLMAVLFSLLGAGLSFITGEMLLKLVGGLPSYVVMALYFGLAAVIIAVMVMVSQSISPKLVGYRWKVQHYKSSLKLLMPAALLMVGTAAGLFQFIYGLEINKPQTVKDIVIAVDRSSSMLQTDPEGERFKAISHFIEGLSGDKKVALMTFNEHPKLEIDFTEVATSEEKEAFNLKIENLNIKDDGQTGIKEVVDCAYELIKDSGRRSSLILVSDGGPTDGSGADIEGLVADFKQKNIPIYTIGMMYTEPSADAYLHEIATLTGGKCYSTSDTTMLKEAFGQIRYQDEKGVLLSARTGIYMSSPLYKGLRIAFLTALALLIALALGIIFDNRFLVKGMMIGALIGGLIGGISAERLLSNELAGCFARGIYWLAVGISLMAFTGLINFKDSNHQVRRDKDHGSEMV